MTFDVKALPIEDRWILSQTSRAVVAVRTFAALRDWRTAFLAYLEDPELPHLARSILTTIRESHPPLHVPVRDRKSVGISSVTHACSKQSM